jgi:hypothetical protein
MEWLILIAVAAVGYIWWAGRKDRRGGGSGSGDGSGGSDLK